MSISRRHIQCALGALWLVDGLLQLQSFMFGPGFAADIIAPAGDGQPGWVAGPVRFFADFIGGHSVATNAVFAVVQLLLGLGLLIRRAIRPVLVVSIAWALGVWSFGEGLGGLASVHASLITGAPGAVVLYAVLAIAAWPRSAFELDTRPSEGWLVASWATVWIGGAFLQALPAQRQARSLAAQIRANAQGAPSWLAAVDRSASAAIGGAGTPLLLILVAVMMLIGFGALRSGWPRRAATIAGAALAATFWLVGQNLGQLYTGRATDPNTGPLLILIALGVLAISYPAQSADVASAQLHPREHQPREHHPVRRPVHA